MNLQSIRENFNRGQMKVDEIKWLIDTVESLQKVEKEFINLSQSIEEDDAMIQQLEDEIKLLLLQKTILLERVKKAESKTRFHKYMELEQQNLALAKEISWYKQMLKEGQKV